MTQFLRFSIFGALAGAALTAWFSPNFIGWYFAPPVDTLMNCRPAVDWALTVYRKSMLIGGLIGVLITTAGYFMFFARKKKDAPKTA